MSTTRSKFPPNPDAGGNPPPVQTWLEYGARLTFVRGDMSQAKFAAKIGVHKNTLGNYERGEREVSASALRSMVYLGWNANWLLTGEEPKRLDDYGTPHTTAMQVREPAKTRVAPASQQEVALNMDALFFAIAAVLAEESQSGTRLPLSEHVARVAHAYRMHAYSEANQVSLQAGHDYASRAAAADSTAPTFYATALTGSKPPESG